MQNNNRWVLRYRWRRGARELVSSPSQQVYQWLRATRRSRKNLITTGLNPLAKEVTDAFISEGYDAVFLSFVKFQSALSQSPTVQQVLPIAIPAGDLNPSSAKHVIIEPSPHRAFEQSIRARRRKCHLSRYVRGCGIRARR